VNPQTQQSEAGARAPRLEAIACPLCGAREHAVRWESRDRITTIPGTYRIVACAACGFLYQNPRPVPEDLALCYPTEYPAFHPTGAESHKLLRGEGLRGDADRYVLAARLGYKQWMPARRGPLVRAAAALRAPRVRKLVFPFAGAGRMLDVGCSTGARMTSLKSLGWEVSGIENSPEAAAAARREHKNVYVGDILDAPYPDGAFDLVTCFHVLEHVTDPKATMSRMVRWLAPEGTLVVEVPNGASAGAAWFGPHWFLLDLPRHLYHFDPRSIARLAESCGGRIQTIEHRDSLGTWIGSLELRDADKHHGNVASGATAGAPSDAGANATIRKQRKQRKRWLKPIAYVARAAKRGEILRVFIRRAGASPAK
jgi:SAM-dependent methyltransferase